MTASGEWIAGRILLSESLPADISRNHRLFSRVVFQLWPSLALTPPSCSAPRIRPKVES